MNQTAKPELVVADDSRDAARIAAESFCVTANAAIAARGVCDVALAGGSTPKATHALLASEPYRTLAFWRRIRFFFSDERCVSPDNEESNFHAARETLFDPLDISDNNIFRMRGEDAPADAARAYERTLVSNLGAEPVFDLILLGMGPDGHTASLFPGTPPDDGSRALVQARVAPSGMTIRHRLTLTPRVLNAARKILIAVNGSEKAEALARAFNDPYDPTACPVQIVRPTNGRCTWLADKAAAALLI